MNTSTWMQQVAFRYGRAFSVVHNGLALLGFVVLAAAVFYGGRLAGNSASDALDVRAMVFGQIRYAAGGTAEVPGDSEAENQQHRALASSLARRYRVASDAAEQFIGAAFEASRQVGIDPLLILAVMAVESRFNPIAESEFGAKGLMQVIPRHHQDKVEEVGGAQAVLDPFNNIMIGARILKQYIRQTGSVETALQIYNGALADPSNQYAMKVMAEQERMRQAMRVNRPLAKAPAV